MAKAAIQEINRARDRSLGRIVPTQRKGQSPIRKERPTSSTEPAGSVPSGANVRSRVVAIQKDLNSRRTSNSCKSQRIGAAQNVEEKMIKRSEGMEPRFISWNAVALHVFDFTFPDLWSRKKPEVPSGHWNDVYAPANDKSRLKWPIMETVVMMEEMQTKRNMEKMTPWKGRVTY